MAIREELVTSAVQFLHDPSVSSSTVENRVSFLRSKNLTQEEIDVALQRAGGNPPPTSTPAYPGPSGPPQPYYQQFSPHAWQPPPPPRRDWRDWFIMATVAGGVGYGIYALGKRYVMPIVAPPTPEKLEQDKKSIEEQFDRAFSLVEQLSKDTEELKKAEHERTERLDTAMSDLESVMSDLKSANRRREDDAQRLRDEVQALKDAIPKALNTQKDLTDNRLREINNELGSLKTLVSQRINSAPATPATPAPPAPTPRTLNGNLPVPVSASKQATVADEAAEKPATPSPAVEPPTSLAQSTFNRTSSARGSGSGSTGKASIPAWQMAFTNQNQEKTEQAEASGSA